MDELSAPVEQWKPVVGLEGWYEVSDLGRVRSVDRLVEYSDGRKPRLWPSVVLRQQPDKDGYPVVNLRRWLPVVSSRWREGS